MSEIPPGVSPDHDDTDGVLPAIDDRLVEPGLRLEIIDGKLSYVPPADPPHATAHFALAMIIGAHRADGFTVALDMLTRTSRIDDIAPDLSVFPSAPDPVTGGRQLEEVAFEIASTESLGHVTTKARKLATRGVRRVFALDLDRGRVLEWSTSLDAWSIVALDGHIEDPVFAVLLPVAPLLDAARLDDTTVGAYRQRRHPAFLAERAEGEREGLEQGRAEGAVALAATILEILVHRGLQPSSSDALHLRGERDLERLARWAAAAWTVEDVAALLAIT